MEAAMAVGGFKKSSGIAALAIGLAALALPATASAQERGWGGRGGQQSGEARQSGGGEQRSAWQGRGGGENRGGGEHRGGFRGNRDGQQAPQAQAPVQSQVQQQPQVQARAPWQGNRGNAERSWRQGNPQQNVQRAPWNGGNDQRGNWNRDNDRRQEAQRNWNGNDNRSRFDNNRSRFDDNRARFGSNDRGWNNNWRRDNRYNWSSYRNANRNLFRGDRYYSPYRNWSYRRLGIGFTLQPLFYSSSYWINDPWQYRLPDAYGPYRWVRYYDDSLLVDIYTGEVVDVINDFFW
jgi:hypothetical protein